MCVRALMGFLVSSLTDACDVFVLAVQGSWSYDDRKDMEMLTKFATDEDFVPQESMCEYASLVMEDLKLVRSGFSHRHRALHVQDVISCDDSNMTIMTNK